MFITSPPPDKAILYSGTDICQIIDRSSDTFTIYIQTTPDIIIPENTLTHDIYEIGEYGDDYINMHIFSLPNNEKTGIIAPAYRECQKIYLNYDSGVTFGFTSRIKYMYNVNLLDFSLVERPMELISNGLDTKARVPEPLYFNFRKIESITYLLENANVVNLTLVIPNTIRSYDGMIGSRIFTNVIVRSMTFIIDCDMSIINGAFTQNNATTMFDCSFINTIIVNYTHGRIEPAQAFVDWLMSAGFTSTLGNEVTV